MSAPLTRTALAPFARRRWKSRKFIGGEPMKSATNMRRRPVVDLLRRAELLDDAVVHDRDLVGHRHGLELVVGDVDGGRLDAVVQLAQLAAHEVAELGVERAERLVHEERHRPADDGAAERHALAVAAGEAARPAGRGDGRCAGSRAVSSTRSRISARGTPWHFSGKPMFCRTFMCG